MNQILGADCKNYAEQAARIMQNLPENDALNMSRMLSLHAALWNRQWCLTVLIFHKFINFVKSVAYNEI